MEQKGTKIELASGIKISYYEQGDADGLPMILIPGLADSWRVFERLIPHVPKTIRLFALTQRGHGDSSRPASGYQTKDFADDLLLFMGACSLQQAVIVGASSGGFAARTFAADHPERTLALVLLGCPATLQDNPMVQAMWDSSLFKLSDPVPREFAEEFSRDVYVRPVPPEFLEMTLQENLKLPAHVWRDTVRGILAESFPGKLTRIQCPTLILWGEEDPLLDPLSQAQLARSIPDSRLVSLSQAGHMLYCEAPEETAAQIMAFVSTVPQGEDGWVGRK